MSELSRKYWELDPKLGSLVVKDDVLFARGWCWPTEGDATALLETSKFMVDGKLIPKPLAWSQVRDAFALTAPTAARGVRQERTQAGRRAFNASERQGPARRAGVGAADLARSHVMRDRPSFEGENHMIVGFIGLGTMGAPMARNILNKGHSLIVVDVQPAAVAALVAAGATAAATPREVAAAQRDRDHHAARCARRRARRARAERHRRGHQARAPSTST